MEEVARSASQPSPNLAPPSESGRCCTAWLTSAMASVAKCLMLWARLTNRMDQVRTGKWTSTFAPLAQDFRGSGPALPMSTALPPRSGAVRRGPVLEAGKRRYQDKFCGARLRGEKCDYRSHRRGGDAPCGFSPQTLELYRNAAASLT